MKKTIFKQTLIAILGSMLLFSSAQADANSGTYLTGNDYRQWPEELRFMYIMGELEGSEMYNPTVRSVMGICAVGMNSTRGQQSAIVDKYVANHPEKWGFPLPLLIFNALTEACSAAGVKIN